MSADFKFNTVGRVDFGTGQSANCGAACAVLNIRRAFVVTDPGIVSLGLLEPALASLEQSGVSHIIFEDVVADPPDSTVLAAAEFARREHCDGVIGLGGGSSMDTAKLVAALLGGEQSLSEMYGVDQVTNPRIPLIQIPTTAGTGSEVTAVAIVTTGATTKAGVVSSTLLADTVLLDPELTLGLPPAVTAATGIDAMVHAIEAYTSARLKNPLSDMLAREALRLMAPALPRAVTSGSDIDARSDMLLGAMLAGQAFANAPVAAVHALAYPLGGNYHIPHGLSNALVLPHVLRFNAPAAAGLYSELLPLICPGHTTTGAETDAAEFLADHFLQLSANMGLQTRLSEMEIDESSLDMLADEAMLQQRLLINNPRTVAREDVLNMYRAAY